MEIVSTPVPGDAAWDDYVRSHPNGTAFHESAWTRAVLAAYRHPAELLTARDGARITGVLPLFHVKSFLFGSRLVSTAFGIYGGILADDPATAAALAQAARDLAADRKAKYVELKSREVALPQLPVKDLYFTFRIPIAPTFDATLKGLNKKMRQDLRRLDGGREFTFVEDLDVPTFYQLYLHTLRFHGTPPFPLRWFEALVKGFGDRIRILGARHGDTWVGASMLLVDRDSLMPLYTGVPRQYYRLRTIPALHARELRMCEERKLAFLDLGRSKKGTGAFDAKTHWGIEPTPLGYQYLMAPGMALPNLSPTNPKFQPLIAMWKRLPIGATRILGPTLNASLA